MAAKYLHTPPSYTPMQVPYPSSSEPVQRNTLPAASYVPPWQCHTPLAASYPFDIVIPLWQLYHQLAVLCSDGIDIAKL